MLDISDRDLYADHVPYDFFAELRERPGLYWQVEQDGPGYWAVTRYHDILPIYRDWRTFSSAAKSAQMHNYDESVLVMLRRMLPNMDPPEHTEFRRIYMRWISAHLDWLRSQVDGIVASQMEPLEGREEIDFLADFARYVPVRVIGMMMGVPESDLSLMLDWCDRLAGVDDPEFHDAGLAAAMEVIAYTTELAASFRREPQDNLTSDLANATIDGRALDDLEVGLQFLAMLVGGNETTRQGMCYFILGYDTMAEARRTDCLVNLRNAGEEALRWGSPVLGSRRTATQDVEVAGTKIAAGDKVFLYYASADRDPAQYVDPDEFDVTRRNASTHLQFGAMGPHRCLGAAITQMEMDSTIRHLVRAYPRLRVSGPVTRLRSNFFNAVKTLPIRLEGHDAG